MNRTRALLYAVLVLAVPLPALALERGEGAGSLDVQASLGGCGVTDAAISCRIEIAYSGVPDAEYYTASVTAPSGSVIELGTISSSGGGGASTSVSVPYSGDGEYAVTVSAWGYDERGRPAVVKSERTGAARDGVRGGSGRARIVEPRGEPAPDAQPAPDAEPRVPPGIEPPACPPAEQADSGRAVPGAGADPDADSEPDPDTELGEAEDPECDPPPEEPLPPPVP